MCAFKLRWSHWTEPWQPANACKQTQCKALTDSPLWLPASTFKNSNFNNLFSTVTYRNENTSRVPCTTHQRHTHTFEKQWLLASPPCKCLCTYVQVKYSIFIPTIQTSDAAGTNQVLSTCWVAFWSRNTQCQEQQTGKDGSSMLVFVHCDLRPFQGIPHLVSNTGQTGCRWHQATTNSRIGFRHPDADVKTSQRV